MKRNYMNFYGNLMKSSDAYLVKLLQTLAKTDPLERVNLAYRGHKRTPAQQREYLCLRRKLARVERTRLQPLS